MCTILPVFTRFSFLSYLFYLRSTEFYFVSWTWNPKRLECMLWRLLAVFFSTVQPSKWINTLPYAFQFNLGNIDLNKNMIVAVAIAIPSIANTPPPKKKKKIGTSTLFEPMASALAHRCSTQLSYEDSYIGSRPICWVHLDPWKDWNTNMMWTAEIQN